MYFLASHKVWCVYGKVYIYTMARCATVHQQGSAEGKGERSDQACIAKDWKHIWSVKAPPKMKIVLWRFAHDCLPTGQQLQMRNICSYNPCCHCSRDETLEHTFLTCQYVTEIWKELKSRCGIRKMNKKFLLPREWIFQTLSDCTEREATLLAITFWHIWEQRNAIRNG